MTSDLPYGPRVSAVLDPLRNGFHVVNRYVAAPMIRVGAGPLLATRLTGRILVLRTVGRSAVVREAPLGYAVVDGKVAVIAGYRRQAHWFMNALANPQVEVALPGGVFAGVAEELTEPVARREAFRAVIAALGPLGPLMLGDVSAMPDGEVDDLAEAFPVLAVTPTAVMPGPYDPGGVFTKANPAAGRRVDRPVPFRSVLDAGIGPHGILLREQQHRQRRPRDRRPGALVGRGRRSPDGGDGQAIGGLPSEPVLGGGGHRPGRHLHTPGLPHPGAPVRHRPHRPLPVASTAGGPGPVGQPPAIPLTSPPAQDPRSMESEARPGDRGDHLALRDGAAVSAPGGDPGRWGPQP